MARRKHRNRAPRTDPATKAFEQGWKTVREHPLFAPLEQMTWLVRDPDRSRCPVDGWAIVSDTETIHVHPTRRGEPEEWTWVLAHCLLHLGFGHIRPQKNMRAWNVACDVVVDHFLAGLKLGRAPKGVIVPERRSAHEEKLYIQLQRGHIPADLLATGTAGPGVADMELEQVEGNHRFTSWTRKQWLEEWERRFAYALTSAATHAVSVAGGDLENNGSHQRTKSAAERARRWFVASFPLLGALASSFEIVEQPEVCRRLGISVAAIDPESQELFISPGAGLGESECRFVVAHELLHVGLRHLQRRQGRDPFLWNVACDYVINGWLQEMGVGEMPSLGALYDPELDKLSAEAVYDRIVTDLRRYRRLCSFAGRGAPDILERGQPGWWCGARGMELDDFYRRCLTQGLSYHESEGRGFLPGGLIEEIRALDQPPISWDVELARWFDYHFAPLEKHRTYARPSRRQSATPDIPRPRYVEAPTENKGRTFGVVLDTSCSMDRKLLAKSLGAIASYSMARDVPAARVVFCDAAVYDQGYLPPEAIADVVKVKGRGGTVLQPAIDLLERAPDFPKDGPILIITDGWCDRLRVRRDHAFLLPRGAALPFAPKGQIFRVE